MQINYVIASAQADAHYAKEAFDLASALFDAIPEGDAQKELARKLLKSARSAKRCTAHTLEYLQEEAVCDARR